jgi:hypothetical protein
MKEMIAYCGLACHECGAYLATVNDDNEKRAEVAAEWSKLFKAEIKPESINCDGCQSNTGRLFSYCNACEIRKCGHEKSVQNCAYCADYACDKLEWIFKAVPQTKQQLDQIKAAL